MQIFQPCRTNKVTKPWSAHVFDPFVAVVPHGSQSAPSATSAEGKFSKEGCNVILCINDVAQKGAPTSSDILPLIGCLAHSVSVSLQIILAGKQVCLLQSSSPFESHEGERCLQWSEISRLQ